jgi:hypothetical protein|tara:strand:+ start:4228 stop:4428 length:201 start_codon:yes stop_codon:yes gene_type:complete
MKRLTIHLKRVNKDSKVKDGKTISKIVNTLSYLVKDSNEAKMIVTHINESDHPRNNVKKWYMSNMV